VKPRLPRRAIAAAVLSLAVVASTAACRVEQGAAIFVGDTRIAESEVSQLVDSLDSENLTGVGDLRAAIVEALVVVEVGKRIAEDTGATPDRDKEGQLLEQLSQMNRLPKDNPVIRLLAEKEAYRPLLVAEADPVDPTEHDVDAMSANVADAIGGKVTPEIRAGIVADLESETGRELTGQRHQVLDYFTDYDVSVNPRFGETSVVIYADQQNNPIITAPIPQ